MLFSHIKIFQILLNLTWGLLGSIVEYLDPVVMCNYCGNGASPVNNNEPSYIKEVKQRKMKATIDFDCGTILQ